MIGEAETETHPQKHSRAALKSIDSPSLPIASQQRSGCRPREAMLFYQQAVLEPAAPVGDCVRGDRGLRAGGRAERSGPQLDFSGGAPDENEPLLQLARCYRIAA
jgi:hypothetical protein